MMYISMKDKPLKHIFQTTHYVMPDDIRAADYTDLYQFLLIDILISTEMEKTGAIL